VKQSAADARSWVNWVVVGALTLLALLLPTANSTLDAWYYAACVRWRHDLLLPHHLLYNPAGVAWVGLLPNGWDVLAALKVLNALLFGGILLALRPVLRAAGGGNVPVWALLLVVGASFGLLRFATENEAYIAPVFVSLVGSAVWCRWVQTRHLGWAVLAGTLTASACLMHQIHFWWWLALALATWLGQPLRWRAAIAYALPALLVPAAYALAAHHEGYPMTPTGLTQFILHDYVVSGATPSAGLKAFLLTPINLVRTFGQVHGSGLALARQFPVAVSGLLLVVMVLVWQARRGWGGRRIPTDHQRLVARAHAGVLGLHVMFAAINDGNAEFMVMVPPLLAVLAAAWGQWRGAAVGYAGAALLIWNLGFGLLPARFLNFSQSQKLLMRIQTEPRATFLLIDQHLPENQLTYRTGQFLWPSLHPAPTLWVHRHRDDPQRFHQWLDSLLTAGHPVYTDALDAPRLTDRASLTADNHDATLLQGYRQVRVDTLPFAFGPRYLTALRVVQPVKASATATPNTGKAR
jgi:hypothetical protein